MNALYSWFPWIVLILLVVALIYAFWKVSGNPELPARISAIDSEQEKAETPA